MRFDIIALDKSDYHYKKITVRTIKKLFGFFPKKGKIDVYLIGGRRMKFLNKKFRGKDKPTNVLSFVNPIGFPSDSLGEVYLNPLFIKKNRQDMNLMLIHGVLHILGYDHIKKNDRIKMEKKEEQLLLKLAVDR